MEVFHIKTVKEISQEETEWRHHGWIFFFLADWFREVEGEGMQGT